MENNYQEIAAWLRLIQTEGIGPDSARKLLKVFGLPQNIFDASPTALRQVVSERAAHALCAAPDAKFSALVQATFDWAQQPDHYFLTFADPRYPQQLLSIADPPPVLYVRGRIELLAAPTLALVGSRNATPQGISNAEQFARALAQAGLTIASGLALGIDAAAHIGALDGAGSTVAVIGTGIDIVYPARNHSLAHRIAEQGVIVSEFVLGTPAISHHFPRRNRIISGLARGVLVVEAAAQSGSLITARLAAEQGREVFAIPGSIHSPLSKGCHRLIKQGAKLVESAQDILEEFDLHLSPAMPKATVSAEAAQNGQDSLLAALGYDPVSSQVLLARSGLTPAALAARLLELELQGLVTRLPGDVYQQVS